MHATTSDADADELRVCGDRQGACPNGSHGHFKWVAAETYTGEDVYILEGLASLRRRASDRRAAGLLT